MSEYNRTDAAFIGRIPKDNFHLYQKDGILFAVIGELERLKQERLRMTISGLNLSTPEGISLAQKEMGILEGIELVISTLEGMRNEPASAN